MLRFFTLSLVFVLFGCNEVMVTIPEFTPPDTEKTVLIEELTGVNCPNCPQGAAKLQELIERFPRNVIGVSIHGQFLADPLSNSKYDFRSDMANSLENYLMPIFGKPAAAFNRVQQPNQNEFAISAFDLWGQFVDAELAKPQTMALDIINTYNPNTRELNIDVDIEALQDITGDIRISVMILESHIIDAQKDVSVIIDDYEHNHMLRDMLTPFDGRSLTSNLIQNEIFNIDFDYTIPDEEDELWIPENMEVIVFIHEVTPETKEIFQAAHADVIN